MQNALELKLRQKGITESMVNQGLWGETAEGEKLINIKTYGGVAAKDGSGSQSQKFRDG